MRKFITLCVVLLALMGWSTVGSADTGTVKILGDEQFVPNAMIMATFKFAPGPLSATSGASVTWDNTASGASADEPHTITLVRQDQLPASIDQVFGCGAPGTACETAFTARNPDGSCPAGSLGGPPGSPCVWITHNVGNSGLDAIGDSFLVFPHSTRDLTISASPGSTLYYLCGIHPWMQGSISVR
ncbi:MAG: hypothetical protein AUH85_13160 [Chloroflexi bacterium 13_1_40CM_4_68_4]|nr:MAG: hypothetical protein AUH85_13160 [Chloroflexi bacterium 13_1_40CM_4_68_4]